MAWRPEFCQHRERTLRCIAAYGHAGPHDMQPATSVTVQILDRQEATARRLSDVDEDVPLQRVAEATDAALGEGAQPA